MNEHVIVVTKKGEVTISVNGVKGASCKDATAALEKKLGAVTEDQLTNEYYEQEQQLQHGSVA